MSSQKLEKKFIEDKDLSFLKDWSKRYNVSASNLKKQIVEKYKEFKTNFPKQDDKIHRLKALRLIKAKYRGTRYSKAENFEGVILATGNIRDLWKNIKEKQADRVRKYFEKGDLNLAVKRKIVKFDDSVKVSKVTEEELEDMLDEYFDEEVKWDKKKLKLLCPKKTKAGKQSKLFGKPIRPPEETRMQDAIGFGMKENDEKPRAFTLQLSGKACVENDVEVLNKAVMFKAIDRSKKEDKYYTLTSNNTNFLDAGESNVTKALKKYDLAVLAEKFLKEFVVDINEMMSWVEEDKIPNKYNNFVVMPDCFVTNIDLIPNDNNNIKLFVEEEYSDNGNSIMIIMPEEKSVLIDFIEGSKAVAIGRCFLADGRNDDDPKSVIFLGGNVIVYEEDKIPLVDVPPYKEDDIDDDDSEEEENEVNETDDDSDDDNSDDDLDVDDVDEDDLDDVFG